MSGTSKGLRWLPALLIAAGLFFLTAGLLSGPPDLIGGMVFGVVSLAAAAAILYRRSADARPQAQAEPGSASEGGGVS
jgi:hypothetical protein